MRNDSVDVCIFCGVLPSLLAPQIATILEAETSTRFVGLGDLPLCMHGGNAFQMVHLLAYSLLACVTGEGAGFPVWFCLAERILGASRCIVAITVYHTDVKPIHNRRDELQNERKTLRFIAGILNRSGDEAGVV
jgi:hypothetical protein